MRRKLEDWEAELIEQERAYRLEIESLDKLAHRKFSPKVITRRRKDASPKHRDASSLEDQHD